MSLNKLQERLNYEFNQSNLLEIALTHRSAGSPNNERLEFLGDAILGAIIAIELCQRFPSGNEGQMTRLRSSLVKKQTLENILNKTLTTIKITI